MKKLIAMIGAVATAFGLYAAEPAKFATSFEVNDDGASDGTTFVPGTGWTWGTDTLSLGAYADDEYEYGEGAYARRNNDFIDTTAQTKYLKLETGTNALSRAVDGNTFLDQLVKFTGFEEYQTNVVAGTKIAVWMSGIETEGTAQIGTPQIGTPQIGTPAQGVEGEDGYVPASPDYQPASPDYQPASPDYQPASSDYIAGETNLYITVGKVTASGTETVALKIAGSYKLDTWYRLTIKSIGDIYGGETASEDPRAGFIVYVDGNQVAAVDDAAKTLIEYDSEMTAAAKGYMAAKQLFPAIDNTDATFATVGYQGIGAIDDIILDTDGPAFAQTVDIEPEMLALPEEVEIASVKVDGKEIPLTDGKYVVKPGDTVVVTFKATDGFFVNPPSKTFENVSKQTDFDVSGEIEVEAAAVIVTINDNDPVYYMSLTDAYAELAGNIGHDDTVAIEIFSQTLLEIEEQPIYELNANTTINIYPAGQDYPAGAWEVLIGDYEEGEEEEVTTVPGTASNNLGAMPGKTMLVSFTGDDDEDLNDGRAFNLQGNIYGYGEDETLIQVAGNTVLTGDLTIGAACDGASTGNCGATLKTDSIDVGDYEITLVGKGKVITLDETLEISDGDGGSIVPTLDEESGYYVYALSAEPETYEVMVAEPVEHCTVKVEISGLEPAYEGGKYEAPIDATVVVTYTPDKDYEITDGQAVWTFTAESESFETTAPSVAQSAPAEAVAKIGAKEFASLDAAFKAAQPNDTVEMITNVVLSEKLTVTGFTGILDLGGYSITNDVAYTGGAKFLIDVVESDLTISNGTVFVTGNMVYARTNSVITIASDATINSEAGGGTPNTFRLYGDGATLNVYGTINKIGVEGGAIDQCVGSSIVNVYEGAKIKSNGYIFKVSVGAGNSPVVNVYGGELETTAGGYAAIYAYNNNTATINLLGGDFIIPLVDNKDGKVFSIAQPDKQMVTGLGADSAVRFSRKSNVADFCASGYSPKFANDWYTIAENPTVIAANIGNKGTLTVTGAGEKVAYGSTISGTLTDVAEGYVPFVFVDGQKVTVGQDGAFEGVVNGSANVAVTYVKADSWFTDPFMRNTNNSGLSNENSQGGAIDEVAGKVFHGASPGYSSAGIIQNDIQKLITGFGENIAPDYAKQISQPSTGEYWSRSIAVAPKYGVVINGNARLATLTAHPYGGVWTNDSYAIAIEGLASNGATGYLPIAIDQDSQYLYGTDWSKGEIIVKYEIVADANDSTKIAKVVKVQEWDLGEESDCGLVVARIGGKDIVYTAYGSNSPIFIIDTATGAVKKVPLQHNGTAYQMAVGGVAEGMPYLMTVSGKAIEVFPLTADGLDLAGTSPMYTVAPKDVLGVAEPNRIGFAITADGKNAFIAYGKTFKGSEGNRTAVATIEKKPANLIVRGKFVTDDEVAQPEDIMPAFGAAVGKTYEAPAGYQITDVTVNGAAVAGFVAGSSFNFTNDALTAYTLVKMSLEALPPVANVTISEVVTPYYDLHDALVAGAGFGSKVELLANVDLTGVAWEPVANFTGTFDGAGYTISNLGITMATGNNVGLFANTVNPGEGKPKPVIKNFTIENVDIKAENSQYVAAVVGNGVGLISNVTVRGSIKIAGMKYVGGIDGHPNTTIVDCKVIGDGAATSFIGANTTAAAQVGGIYGMGPATEAVQVYNCSVEGVTIQAKEHAGGIGGRAQGDVVNVNCTVKNVIVKAGTNAGQLIGQPYGYEGGYNATDYLLNCTVDNVALQDATGAAIADAEYGSGFGSASQLNFIKSSNAVGTGLATAGAKFGLTGGTFTIVNEWTSKPGQAVENLTAQCAAGYAPIANQDGTYTIKQVWDVTFYVGEVVSNAQVVVNGECAKEFAYDTETIEAWTNAAGVAFAFTTPITEATTLYAQLKSTGPVIPVDPDVELTPAGEAAAAEVAEVFGDDLATWVEKVYGDGGKIPASKLNGTTSELIAIAQAYDLPIMTEPEVEIEKAAEGDGFTFQIVDDGTPVAMQAAKVLSMVQFTADLGVAFDAATTDNVEVALSTDSKTATATFKKATNAGFMKVKLATPTK